jgi:hypothetical protein
VDAARTVDIAALRPAASKPRLRAGQVLATLPAMRRLVTGSSILTLALCSACGDSGAGDGAGSGSGGGAVVSGPGSAGTQGSVGSGGATGGDGSASGSGATTGRVTVGVGADDAEQVARAAAVVGACLGDDGANRSAAHLWYGRSNARIWGRLGLQAECLATAGGGCDAAATCLGWSLEPTDEECAASCTGSVFAYCAEGYRQQVDCGALGLGCDPEAFCVDGQAEACDRDTFVNTCDGTTPRICDDGAVHRGPDCAALGLGCAEGSCIGLGTACTGGSRSYQGDVFYDGIACDGATLVACVDGHEHRLDCASLAPGFACHGVDGVAFCGLAAECVPAAPAEGSGPDELCEGSTLVFCNAGRVERIDCVALGFQGCDLAGGQGCVPGLLPR